jgi:hypothetical protein
MLPVLANAPVAMKKRAVTARSLAIEDFMMEKAEIMEIIAMAMP